MEWKWEAECRLGVSWYFSEGEAACVVPTAECGWRNGLMRQAPFPEAPVLREGSPQGPEEERTGAGMEPHVSLLTSQGCVFDCTPDLVRKLGVNSQPHCSELFIH